MGEQSGIIAGALPYLEATSGLDAGQLSFIVTAVLAGSIISTSFSGRLADWIGRRPMMHMSGLLFVISIPIIALAHGFVPLVLGHMLHGISAGFVGVAVPLYLAECLGASNRGKGTGIFQWMLTLGIVAAALIDMGFSIWLGRAEQTGNPEQLLAAKNFAWRCILWVSLPPGILFVLGSLYVSESARWLFRKGRVAAARAALLRSRTGAQAELELQEMAETLAAEKAKSSNTGVQIRESLFSRRYIIPFVMACVILACTQATGVNSIIGYNATILIQAGLSDANAHLGYVILTLVNFLMTMIGVVLVDKKGRKFLLSVGSAGIIVSLIATGLFFHQTEKHRVEVKDAVQALVVLSNQTATAEFNTATANTMLAGKASSQPSTLVVIYSYGDFRAASKVVRSDDLAAKVEINRDGCLPPNKVAAFFQNPFADQKKSQVAPLTIDNALITPVPSQGTGWLTAVCIFCFMAFFAAGPGVCVWLALAELMPTRIRSNGMSIALLINQAVSTIIAAFFLPSVGKHGYATMFFVFAGCTVAYFITATFFLPETKGKTLEEIEEHFEGKK